jgi:hypothetical protein
MPPVSQGSRGVLVTWSVITGILFVFAAVMAIYFYVDASKQTTRYNEITRKYNDYIAPGDLTGPVVGDLKALRTAEPPLPGVTASTPLFNVLAEQRNQFAALVGGPTAKDAPGTAAPAASAALTKAAAVAKEAGITIPTGDNLAQAVSNLSDGLASANQKNKDLQSQVAAAKAQQAEQVKQFDQARAAMNKGLEDIRSEQAKGAQAVTGYQEETHKAIAGIEAERAREREQYQQQLANAQVQQGELQRKIDQLTEDNDALKRRLGLDRISTEDVILRQPAWAWTASAPKTSSSASRTAWSCASPPRTSCTSIWARRTPSRRA